MTKNMHKQKWQEVDQKIKIKINGKKYLAFHIQGKHAWGGGAILRSILYFII